MKIIRTVRAMQKWALAQRQAGLTIGFVPTMGALHEGHISLTRIARRRADLVVASIFVNPKQFGPREDFSKYPRAEKQDARMLKAAGVDVLFLPSVDEVYPGGHATSVNVEGLTSGLCGPFRPSHFQGVATVVAKLFNMVSPDVAVFGEKDFQQLAVIRRMTADLNFPIRIVGGPTLRDADGLAMSSRNRYLGAEERHRALAIPRALFEARERAAAGVTDVPTLRDGVIQRLGQAGLKVQYVEFVDPESLRPADKVHGPTQLAAAAFCGDTRLIDNLRIDPPRRKKNR
ncbi:MAG: Pantothenate synthetase [Myxococcota bacterium]|nr:Pantothenate synthetase [Myxococcota bacterium]